MSSGSLGNLGVMLAGVKLANPGALWLLIAVGMILAWSLLGVDAPRKLFAPLLRAAVLALCVLALADPQTITRSEGTTRPAVVDASASITAAMRAWTAKLLRDDLETARGRSGGNLRYQPRADHGLGRAREARRGGGMLHLRAGCDRPRSGARESRRQSSRA